MKVDRTYLFDSSFSQRGFKDFWRYAEYEVRKQFPIQHNYSCGNIQLWHDFPPNYCPHSVLIVGGGISANYNLPLSDYDEVWTMNRGYKKLKGADLLYVGPNVDLKDEELKYKIHYKSIETLLFSPHSKWRAHHDPSWKNQIAGLNTTKRYFHSIIFGVVGSGARLVHLAAEIGIKHIGFTGFDGPEAIIEGKHAFEPGKTYLPDGCTEENASEIFKEQYDSFWTLMHDWYPDTNFTCFCRNKYHELC